MRESDDSKIKPKLWMVEEGASEKFGGISIERRDTISRKEFTRKTKLAMLWKTKIFKKK